MADKIDQATAARSQLDHLTVLQETVEGSLDAREFAADEREPATDMVLATSRAAQGNITDRLEGAPEIPALPLGTEGAGTHRASPLPGARSSASRFSSAEAIAADTHTTTSFLSPAEAGNAAASPAAPAEIVINGPSPAATSFLDQEVSSGNQGMGSSDSGVSGGEGSGGETGGGTGGETGGEEGDQDGNPDHDDHGQDEGRGRPSFGPESEADHDQGFGNDGRDVGNDKTEASSSPHDEPPGREQQNAGEDRHEEHEGHGNNGQDNEDHGRPSFGPESEADHDQGFGNDGRDVGNDKTEASSSPHDEPPGRDEDVPFDDPSPSGNGWLGVVDHGNENHAGNGSSGQESPKEQHLDNTPPATHEDATTHDVDKAAGTHGH